MRRIRKQLCKSQELLAFDSCLDRTYISLLECGRRSPTLDTLVAICDATGIGLEELASLIEIELHAPGRNTDDSDPS